MLAAEIAVGLSPASVLLGLICIMVADRIWMAHDRSVRQPVLAPDADHHTHSGDGRERDSLDTASNAPYHNEISSYRPARFK